MRKIISIVLVFCFLMSNVSSALSPSLRMDDLGKGRGRTCLRFAEIALTARLAELSDDIEHARDIEVVKTAFRKNERRRQALEPKRTKKEKAGRKPTVEVVFEAMEQPIEGTTGFVVPVHVTMIIDGKPVTEQHRLSFFTVKKGKCFPVTEFSREEEQLTLILKEQQAKAAAARREEEVIEVLEAIVDARPVSVSEHEKTAILTTYDMMTESQLSVHPELYDVFNTAPGEYSIIAKATRVGIAFVKRVGDQWVIEGHFSGGMNADDVARQAEEQKAIDAINKGLNEKYAKKALTPGIDTMALSRLIWERIKQLDRKREYAVYITTGAHNSNPVMLIECEEGHRIENVVDPRKKGVLPRELPDEDGEMVDATFEEVWDDILATSDEGATFIVDGRTVERELQDTVLIDLGLLQARALGTTEVTGKRKLEILRIYATHAGEHVNTVILNADLYRVFERRPDRHYAVLDPVKRSGDLIRNEAGRWEYMGGFSGGMNADDAAKAEDYNRKVRVGRHFLGVIDPKRRTVRVSDEETGKFILTMPEGSQVLESNNQFVLVSDIKGRLTVYSRKTHKPVRGIENIIPRYDYRGYHITETHFAVMVGNEVISIYDLNKGKLILQLDEEIREKQGWNGPHHVQVSKDYVAVKVDEWPDFAPEPDKCIGADLKAVLVFNLKTGKVVATRYCTYLRDDAGFILTDDLLATQIRTTRGYSNQAFVVSVTDLRTGRSVSTDISGDGDDESIWWKNAEKRLRERQRRSRKTKAAQSKKLLAKGDPKRAQVLKQYAAFFTKGTGLTLSSKELGELRVFDRHDGSFVILDKNNRGGNFYPGDKNTESRFEPFSGGMTADDADRARRPREIRRVLQIIGPNQGPVHRASPNSSLMLWRPELDIVLTDVKHAKEVYEQAKQSGQPFDLILARHYRHVISHANVDKEVPILAISEYPLDTSSEQDEVQRLREEGYYIKHIMYGEGIGNVIAQLDELTRDLETLPDKGAFAKPSSVNRILVRVNAPIKEKLIDYIKAWRNDVEIVTVNNLRDAAKEYAEAKVQDRPFGIVLTDSDALAQYIEGEVPVLIFGHYGVNLIEKSRTNEGRPVYWKMFDPRESIYESKIIKSLTSAADSLKKNDTGVPRSKTPRENMNVAERKPIRVSENEKIAILAAYDMITESQLSVHPELYDVFNTAPGEYSILDVATRVGIAFVKRVGDQWAIEGHFSGGMNADDVTRQTEQARVRAQIGTMLQKRRYANVREELVATFALWEASRDWDTTSIESGETELLDKILTQEARMLFDNICGAIREHPKCNEFLRSKEFAVLPADVKSAFSDGMNADDEQPGNNVATPKFMLMSELAEQVRSIWAEQEKNTGGAVLPPKAFANALRELGLTGLSDGDSKRPWIFSQGVTFGIYNGATNEYESGLAAWLPMLANSGIKIAVIVDENNKEERALIDQLNGQIINAENKIKVASNVVEARAQFKGAHQCYYFWRAGDPEDEANVRGVTSYNVTKIINDILRSMGELCGMIDLLPKMRDIAREIAVAA